MLYSALCVELALNLGYAQQISMSHFTTEIHKMKQEIINFLDIFSHLTTQEASFTADMVYRIVAFQSWMQIRDVQRLQENAKRANIIRSFQKVYNRVSALCL